MKKFVDFIKVLFRRLRLVKINRNFLVFLVFVGISTAFWFIQTLQDNSQNEVEFVINITDEPQGVLYTSEKPQSISVKLGGRGKIIVPYVLGQMLNDKQYDIDINFNEVSNGRGKLEIDNNAIRKAVTKKIPNGLVFVSSNPGKIDVFYATGKPKYVPIKFGGVVSTTNNHILCGIRFSPDSVKVTAPSYLFSSIKYITTEDGKWENLEDTVVTKLALVAPAGVKIEPDSAEVKICVDLVTDKTLSATIFSENTPKNKYLRIFPQQAEITFRVNSMLYNSITAEDFLLAIDYNDIKEDTKQCRIHLRQKPDNVHNIRISPEYVEFFVEQEN
ncbi:MAG: YbbR-like domain-containing protein [Bacteroidaceae bacterium]|nr:YbbR-like domain-containing protein [Bacteroidaceae bacterium]